MKQKSKPVMMTTTTSMKTQKMIAPMSEAERVHVVCTHTHESPSVNTWDEHFVITKLFSKSVYVHLIFSVYCYLPTPCADWDRKASPNLQKKENNDNFHLLLRDATSIIQRPRLIDFCRSPLSLDWDRLLCLYVFVSYTFLFLLQILYLWIK